uniref:Uncharacterized protein n=1 Tax=Solanum tuberosum TaxID=4113 RepID=M1DVM3_SOLTU
MRTMACEVGRDLHLFIPLSAHLKPSHWFSFTGSTTDRYEGHEQVDVKEENAEELKQVKTTDDLTGCGSHHRLWSSQRAVEVLVELNQCFDLEELKLEVTK